MSFRPIAGQGNEVIIAAHGRELAAVSGEIVEMGCSFPAAG